ncbi:MAG TPA: hypothetical protein VIG71_02915 [Enteractinococcus sp.]
MTERKSPFEDPEFHGLPPGAKIGHQPGTADQLMHEIAPLLAAEGIDVYNLEHVELEVLNAAMARALDRRTMELLTPIGDQETVTILTLHGIVFALASGTDEQLSQIFATIGPEPTPLRPSVGHLTGVELETLDRWYTEATLRDHFLDAKLTFGSEATRAATQQLQELAYEGRAFRSYDSLIATHDDFELARAGSYAVYISIAAVAAAQHIGIHDAIKTYLPPKQLTKEYVADIPVRPETELWLIEDERYEEFRDWLLDHYGPEEFEAIYELFIELVVEARQEGIDPDDATQIASWLLSVQHSLDYQSVMESVQAISSYVAYRVETSAESAVWLEVLESLDTGVGEDPVAEQFREIIDTADAVPLEDRLKALEQLPLIAGLSELVQWLSTAQPITAMQVPRRADIQVLAEMIGLKAQGVATKPERQREPTAFEDLLASSSTAFDPDFPHIPEVTRSYYVQSALDIPELMAWWSALEVLEVIELTASRVKQGINATDFAQEDCSLESAELVVGLWVSNILVHHIEQTQFEIPAVALVINHLTMAMLGQTVPLTEPPDTAEIGLRITNVAYCRSLRYLHDMGLVQIRDGCLHVPETVHRPIVLGLSSTIQHVTQLLSDFE